MKASYSLRMCVGLLLLVLCATSAPAQSAPNVPEKFRRLFFHYADQRPLYEKALNFIGKSSVPVGRSFALVAGVTQYPNFPPLDRSLRPALVDVEKLKSYLRDQEFFDEIVVLKDGDMNLDNLNYFLESYFPEQLAKSPHARFLFAYSGHGYSVDTNGTTSGFLITSAATSAKDDVNRINLHLVHTLLERVIDSSEKVLVLINACHSGAFLNRRVFGADPLGPGDRGAHAILASRTNQNSLHMDKVGPGSVFFEKIFAGLDGVADTSPRDGVVTYHELVTYLRSEIGNATNGLQIPMDGDISRDGSVGEFFFLNRSKQVQLGNAKPWNPGSAVFFGVQASDELERGRMAFVAHEFAQAFDAFGRAAEAGNASAMNGIGWLYQNGLGVKQDYQQARQWYEKAASAGNLSGMVNLGNLYQHGIGVEPSLQQAKQWYEKAAAEGEAGAMTSLGYLYQYSLGVHQDFGKAREWYARAADAGDGTGMTNLGYLYQFGLGVGRDYDKAREWYEKAADSGRSQGMSNLGYLYEHGLGVKQDYELARKWYEKAATAGHTEGMNNLGYLYQNGLGVKRDYKQAYDWYTKAAIGGDASGMNNLGILYDKGLGVNKDYEQARQWYEKAVKGGNVRAMFHLGVLYEKGHGVKRDYTHARHWYERAAAGGDKDAEERLKKLPK